MNLSGATILITGGSGFLGKHLERALLSRNAITISIGSAAYDLTDSDRAVTLIERTTPDLVIHAAARVGGIGYNVAHPYGVGRDNLVMGLNVIDACAACSVPKLVIVSSCCAYPACPSSLPFAEESLWEDLPEPSNRTYGLAKRMLGTLAAAAVQEKRLPCAATCLLANLYGPGDCYDEDRSHFIPAAIRKFCAAVDEGESIVQLWGSGNPTRDFLHVRDAAEGIVRVCESWDHSEPINLGTAIPRSIRETAAAIACIVGFSGRIEWANDTLDGQMERALDCTKAWNGLGWEAKIDFGAGLRECVADWRARQ